VGNVRIPLVVSLAHAACHLYLFLNLQS